MLEEEHERCGAEEGGILAEELGFAELRRFVRWWLCEGVADYGCSGLGHLLVRGCGCDGCCCGGILSLIS